MKKTAIFLYAILNGTWVVIAYLLHKVGTLLRAIVIVFGIGVVFGNLAAYTGLRLAAKILRRQPEHFE